LEQLADIQRLLEDLDPAWCEAVHVADKCDRARSATRRMLMRDTHPHSAAPSVHLKAIAARIAARQARIADLEHLLLLDLDEGQWCAIDWQLGKLRQGLQDDEQAFDALLNQVAQSAAEEGP
jgi:hypothetical protein